MKKVISFLLAATMALSLAACGNSGSGGSGDAITIDLSAFYTEMYDSIFPDPDNAPALSEITGDYLEQTYPGLSEVETKQCLAYAPKITAVAYENIQIQEGDIFTTATFTGIYTSELCGEMREEFEMIVLRTGNRWVVEWSPNLIFSDMEMVARRIDRTKKALKGDKKLQAQVDFLERLQAHLEEGKSARGFDFTEDELSWIHDMPLLSAKPVIYAANMSEEDFRNGVDKNEHYQEVKQIAEAEHAAVLPICAKIEEDIADMEADDKAMFLEDLGLEESGLNRIIREGYSLLGLISYLTAGKQEVRAWTITRGTKAPQAAGKIHTDFEKGFIRAEVVSYDDLMACGSMAAAKEKGLVRLEGKEYVMQDGDIVLFRFNV